MKIIFVGTGSGRTSVKRFHSSFLLKTKKHNLLVDAGDGISKALLKQNISFNSINSILFTHYHADHFTGIGALITQMKLANRTNMAKQGGPLKIYTHKNLINPLVSLINSVYMFKENLDFEIDINGFNFDAPVQINEEIKFVARQNSHIFQKDFLNHYPSELFVSSSFLFNSENKNIFYSSDVGNKYDLYLFENEKIDLMIIESMHITPEEIYEAFIKIKPKKLLLTHIDDIQEKELKRWHKKLPDKERRKIFLCYDGMIL